MSNMPFIDVWQHKRTSSNMTPCISTFFSVKGYGQYTLHGSILNVPINLDVMQNVTTYAFWWLFNHCFIKIKIRISPYVC
jgi:hypothetical protein